MRTERTIDMSIQESVQMITLKTIIFDCGRVLTCDQNPGHARAMAESLGVAPAHVVGENENEIGPLG